MNERFEHPSYGMISINNTSGSPKGFFGSDIQNVNHYVTLEIKHGVRENDNGHDHYFSKENIIQVRMTSNQFAAFITSSNRGDGTPCTIERLYNGEYSQEIEQVPEQISNNQLLQNEFKEKTIGIVSSLKDKRAEISALLDKPSLNKKDRTLIEKALDKSIMEIDSNLPYMMEQFRDLTEKVVQSAKTEVDFFITQAVSQTGLESLKEIKLKSLPENSSVIEGIDPTTIK